MTEEEIEQRIKKIGYSVYRKSQLPAESFYHNDGEVWAILAKRKNMTVEEYFRAFPSEYQEYRRSVSVKVGTRNK